MSGRTNMARAAASRMIFPLLLLGPLGLTLWGIAARVPHTVLIAVSIVTAVLLQLVLERVLPYRAAWNRGREVRADLSCLALGAVTAYVFDIAVLAAMYTGAASLTGILGASPWPTRAPLLAQFALAILIADLAHYWIHRALHGVPWLWAFHTMHHGPDHLYTLNFFRMHPVDICLKTAANLIPLILLGAPREVILLWTVMSGISAGSLNHANIDTNTTWLDGWLSTPTLHRFHHSRRPDENDTNFGNITMLYDRLFGTYLAPHGRDVESVGIIEGRKSLPVLLAGPFVRRTRRPV